MVNAARVLAARPRSKAAQENMEIFKEAWEKQVRLLTESVDDITTIHDFLAVSGMSASVIFSFHSSPIEGVGWGWKRDLLKLEKKKLTLPVAELRIVL